MSSALVQAAQKQLSKPPEAHVLLQGPLQLPRGVTISRGAVSYLAESMHGAGSPQAQRVVIGRQAPLDEYKEAAKALAGIASPTS